MWWEPQTLDNFQQFASWDFPLQICKPNLLLNSNQVDLQITSKFDLGEKFQMMSTVSKFASANYKSFRHFDKI